MTVAAGKIGKSSEKLWQIFSACCLQRPPIISKDLNEIEKRYSELLEKEEIEKSYLSSYELQSLKESKIQKEERINLKNKQDSLLTLQEVEDKYMDELKAFTPAPRLDNKVENFNIMGNMDEKVYLITPQQLGQKIYLICPTQLWIKGETLKQTANKALVSALKLSPPISPKFIGNAPIGYYHYKYPKLVQNTTGFVGAKMFFFLAYLQQKDINYFSSKKDDSYKWLTKEDMKTHLNIKYYKAIEPFIFS